MNTQDIGATLVALFAEMVFKHGFVHCDASAGNILVRRQKGEHPFQIVLLDHGRYQAQEDTLTRAFSKLWLAMMRMNMGELRDKAQLLNIRDNLEYLPVLFLARTTKSTKKIGDAIREEERSYFQGRELRNFVAIQKIMRNLPECYADVLRTVDRIGEYNVKLGGTQRLRYFTFTNYAMR
jgi:aarF domain-containing kinase